MNLTCCFLVADTERISCVALITNAGEEMVYYQT